MHAMPTSKLVPLSATSSCERAVVCGYMSRLEPGSCGCSFRGLIGAICCALRTLCSAFCGIASAPDFALPFEPVDMLRVALVGVTDLLPPVLGGVVDLASAPLFLDSDPLLSVLARRSRPDSVEESENVPPGPGVARRKDDLVPSTGAFGCGFALAPATSTEEGSGGAAKVGLEVPDESEIADRVALTVLVGVLSASAIGS